MNNKLFLERVHYLVNTSVDDMESGLWQYGRKDLDLLQKAFLLVRRRGEKTKAKILARKIKALKKEGKK